MFKILSLNTRGLGNAKKRKSVFRWIVSQKSNIIFLQETHSTIDDEITWSNDLTGHFIFSHGSKASRGAAINLRNIDYNIHCVKTDSMGRVVIVSIDIEGKQYYNKFIRPK